MHIDSITGKRCVYNWTNIIIDMGLDNIVHHDRKPSHARIFNYWINYWESEIPRKRDQENLKRVLQKYKNLRFLDDEDNKNYMIDP